MKRFYIFIFLLVAAIWLQAQNIPSGYYNNAANKTGDELKLALHNIIKGHTKKSYAYLWTAYATTDINPTTNFIWDMYSNSQYVIGENQCGEYTQEGNCYNREHLWARSWANKSDDDNDTMVSDLHHIFPTDGWVNALRSNYAFGEVTNATTTTGNGSKLGPNTVSGYNGTVFEPIDEYKGDIARALMYMSVRYLGGDDSWGTSAMTEKSVIKDWAMTMLLKWHHDDPVSTKETNRNNAVYGIQGNRNPFIDNPEYADMIWDPNWSSTYQIYAEANPTTGGSVSIVATVTDNPSIDFSGQGYSDGQAISNATLDSNVGVVFNKGTNTNNAPTYYTSGTAVRCYGGNYFTVNATSGSISKIVLTYGSSDGSNTITTDAGSFSSNTWTGNASSVKFTIGGTSGNRRIKAIEVTYSYQGAPSTQAVCVNGASATFTATPNAGYHFVNWTKGTTVVSTNASFNLTVNESATYRANFAPDIYDIAVASNPAVGGMVVIGNPVSTDFSAQGYTNGQEVSNATIGDNVSVSFNKGTNTSNTPKYYDGGTAIRCYGGNYFEVSANDGFKITAITLTYGSGDGSNAITTDCGSFDTNKWTGSATSVKFTIGGTSGNRRIQTITVTFCAARLAANTTATITATPNTGYSFVNWTKNDVNVSANPSYSFNVTENANLVANFINNNVTADALIPSLTMNGNVTISSNVTLTVTGNITQPANTSILINNGGQLICDNSVNVKMRKSIMAWNATTEKGWYVIASPVDGQTFADVTNLVNTSNNPKHNVYRYNEASVEWEEYRSLTTPTFSSFENGRGYLFRTNNSNGFIEFKGNNNVADVGYNLSYACTANDELKGINLVGNPFTQNITWADITKTNVNLDGYYVLEESGTNQGKWAAVTSASATIAPMRAFLVQAIGENASVSLSRTTSKGETGNAGNNIMLAVSDGQHSDETYIYLKEGHGLNKVEHRNPEIPLLYVVKNGENFAIADMECNTKIVNLGFKAKTIGQYTLSIKTDGDFSYLHLIDRMTGDDVDMLVENSYTFIGTPKDKSDRFVMKLKYQGGDDSEEDVFAYQNGNDIIVEGTGELQVFDMMGRVVSTQSVNGAGTLNALSMPTGVYILRLIGDDIKTQKIVVK